MHLVCLVLCDAGPPVHRERIRVSVPEFNVLPSQGTRAKLETFRQNLSGSEEEASNNDHNGINRWRPQLLTPLKHVLSERLVIRESGDSVTCVVKGLDGQCYLWVITLAPPKSR
jgi:hypothetical protein